MEQWILVPVTVGRWSALRLATVIAQARDGERPVLLLHVLPARAFDPASVSFAEARARTWLDVLVFRLRQMGLRVVARLSRGDPATAILTEARARPCALIVLGYGPRGMARLVRRDVASRVLPAAPCPVLLVPVGEGAGEAPVRSVPDDAALAGPLAPRPLGLRAVEVVKIVGSVERAGELGPDFRPRAARLAAVQRYDRVFQAMARGERLPPVVLYRLGFGYYVCDGHHRVAAARALGWEEIEAEVTAFVPLGDPEAQRLFLARRRFERLTGLTRVEAARPETYSVLEALLRAEEAGRSPEDLGEVARRWYWQVFLPLRRRVRASDLGRSVPGDLSADIIARLGAWRLMVAARTGVWPDWEEALQRWRESAAGPSILAG